MENNNTLDCIIEKTTILHLSFFFDMKKRAQGLVGLYKDMTDLGNVGF